MSDNNKTVFVKSGKYGLSGNFIIGETVEYDPTLNSENFIFSINDGYTRLVPSNDIDSLEITPEHKKLLNDMIPKDNVMNPTDVNGGRAKHTKSKHSRKTRRVRKSKRKGARKSRKH